MIDTSALMLNPDGSAYHLHAFPEDIANTVLLVGDPNRTHLVASHFDRIDVARSHREFILKTGFIGTQRLTVIGTGIGSGNIDIVLNELDMLVNVNLQTKQPLAQQTSLEIIRMGTSGALQKDIEPGSIILSEYAFALDGLLLHYQNIENEQEKNLDQALKAHFHELKMINALYLAQGDPLLLEQFKSLGSLGITFTCSGFYGPQFRQLRAPLIAQDFLQLTSDFNFADKRITNFEMETAAIYGLGRVLGHRCCSINAIVVNRVCDKKYSAIEQLVEKMVKDTLSFLLKK